MSKNEILTLPNFDPQPHLKKAFPEIGNYTAIFIFGDGLVGSGTFVNTCGFDGILTAHHVAKAVFESEEFALCIANREHGLWLQTRDFEHVPIGFPRDRPYSDEGPDLSFIIIRNAILLGILKSLKSFCFLESQQLRFLETPLNRLYWAVAGSPFESKAIVRPDSVPGGSLTKVSNFVGRGIFESRTKRNGFDYIDIKVPCSFENFPENYEGVSGGGFWVIPMEIDSSENVNTIAHAKPLLAGVAFYQSEPLNGEIILTGHGYESVYSGVRDVLKSK